MDEPSTSLSAPLEVGPYSYWVFYNPIYSSSATRIIVAVEDDEGGLVGDEQTLSAIAGHAYDYSVIAEQLKSNGYSFSQLAPALNSAVLAIQKNQASLYEIQAQTSAAYPDISFEGVEYSLEALLESANEASVLAYEGEAQQNIFESDYTAVSLTQLYDYYSLEMDSLGELFDAFDVFSNELSELQSEVYSTVPDPDNENLYKALDALRECGLSGLYPKFRSGDPRASLEVLENRKQAWVEDSVASFLYRRNRIDSAQAYSAESKRYAVIQSSKQMLYGCGLKSEVSELESVWSDVEYYREKDNEFGYSKLNELLPQASEKMDYVYSKQAECTASPTKRVDEDVELDVLTPLVYLIAFGMLGYAAYKYYQKKQLEQMMSE